MSRKITPWKLVVNCLYVVGRPLTIRDEFWMYIGIASGKIQNQFGNVTISDDRYSLENVLWYDNLFIKFDKDKNTVSLDRKLTDSFVESIVNFGLDDDISKQLPSTIKEAYAGL